MASTKVQRIMTQPINLIFRFLQSKARIQIWLFEQKDLRIEGRIIGFDEYMNLVLDDADEINVKKQTRKSLGRILLKGDNITLMMNTDIREIFVVGLVELFSNCITMEFIGWLEDDIGSILDDSYACRNNLNFVI
ncbi:Small nuclear ribonucleoprotein E [Rhynchospora pubera]|uniref:Small nuclear ribonucleoprotein E n=2 Tax=Rhynchospora pubera TaxID=906938 RepID=A0AAV8ET96_9POAL|nr:Small nuclear ribonucleoprotein E [Rhynchospora pubera]